MVNSRRETVCMSDVGRSLWTHKKIQNRSQHTKYKKDHGSSGSYDLSDTTLYHQPHLTNPSITTNLQHQFSSLRIINVFFFTSIQTSQNRWHPNLDQNHRHSLRHIPSRRSSRVLDAPSNTHLPQFTCRTVS